MYFNTTNTKGEQLKLEWGNSNKQEGEILNFFFQHPTNIFTPFEIQREVFGSRVPITSVRRAITNLTHRERLVKTNILKQGEYGKPNYCWKLN